MRYVQRTLFSDPAFSVEQELDFYQHEMDWANRLILGDSLLVMNSLLHRENMASKVQCIYIDPPYGVNYNSNFQPRTDQRDVRDDDKSLTREPEQIRAYRDTWQLGIHSYLTYLRDRLLLARELLSDSGSVFVQISDENVHHVREVLDEVFGPKSVIAHIAFQKTGGFAPTYLPGIFDHLLWYGRDKTLTKFRPLFMDMPESPRNDPNYVWLQLTDGAVRRMTPEERLRHTDLPPGARVFRLGPLQSEGKAARDQPFDFEGKTYRPGSNAHWKTTTAGLSELAKSNLLIAAGNGL